MALLIEYLFHSICSFVAMMKSFFACATFLWILLCVHQAAAQKDSGKNKSAQKGVLLSREVQNREAGSTTKILLDSLGKVDSTNSTFDSIQVRDSVVFNYKVPYNKLLNNPFFPSKSEPINALIAFRDRQSKDELFYLTIGILLLLALIRVGFPSYYERLFQYFFQTSIRQRQTRDRLFQEQIAAVGLNLLFFIVMGTLITLLAIWRGWFIGNFWMLWAASTGLLCIIYAGKYVFLQMVGWVLNNREAMRSYIFVVNLVNKTLAILMLPLLILVAFSTAPLVESSLRIAFMVIIAAFVYRYAVSFTLIRNKMALNAFHFLLYFISLEVIPLLVILKLLFKKLNVFV